MEIVNLANDYAQGIIGKGEVLRGIVSHYYYEGHPKVLEEFEPAIARFPFSVEGFDVFDAAMVTFMLQGHVVEILRFLEGFTYIKSIPSAQLAEMYRISKEPATYFREPFSPLLEGDIQTFLGERYRTKDIKSALGLNYQQIEYLRLRTSLLEISSSEFSQEELNTPGKRRKVADDYYIRLREVAVNNLVEVQKCIYGSLSYLASVRTSK